jgi:hypothetical protein
MGFFFLSIMRYKKLDEFFSKFCWIYTEKKIPQKSQKKTKFVPKKIITGMQEEVSKSFAQRPNPWGEKKR